MTAVKQEPAKLTTVRLIKARYAQVKKLGFIPVEEMTIDGRKQKTGYRLVDTNGVTVLAFSSAFLQCVSNDAFSELMELAAELTDVESIR